MQFYLAVAQGRSPPPPRQQLQDAATDAASSSTSSTSSSSAAPTAFRRRLFDPPSPASTSSSSAAAAVISESREAGQQQQLQLPPLSGTPALRHKVSPGFTKALHWTNIRARAMRRWLMLLDDATAVVAVRRLVALQPPRAAAAAAAGSPLESVRSAEEVVAAMGDFLAAGGGGGAETSAAAAAASFNSSSSSVSSSGRSADAAAVAGGFVNAAHERAAFDLMVAAFCSVMAARVAGFGPRGLLGVGRRLELLGVRHDGFWQVWGVGFSQVLVPALRCLRQVHQQPIGLRFSISYITKPHTQAWCDRAAALMERGALPLPSLAAALHSMQRLGFEPSEAWARQLLAGTQPGLPRLSLAQLGRLAEPAGKLRPAPGSAWWEAALRAASARAAAAAAAAAIASDAAAASGDQRSDRGEQAPLSSALVLDGPAALGAGRLLLGACWSSSNAAAGDQGQQRAAASVVEWCCKVLESTAAAGRLTPAAAVHAAAACGVAMSQPAPQPSDAPLRPLWRSALEQLRADGWRLSEEGLGQLCAALTAAAGSSRSSSSSGSGSSTFPLPEGWLSDFEAATLPQLPSLPPWLLLALVRSFAAQRHQLSERWLGACLLVLQPWVGQLSSRQLAQLADDLTGIISGGPAVALPTVCLAALTSAVAAAVAVDGGRDGDGEAARVAAGRFAALQERSV
jgi:hypothetical protein